MLRTVIAFVVLAVGVAAQPSPNVQVRQLAPSCGGATGFPFVRISTDGWSVQFHYDFRGGEGFVPFLIVGLEPRNIPLPLLPSLAPGCVVGIDPVVWIESFDGRGGGNARIGYLPPPWNGSGFSPFIVGVPLYVQMLGDCDPCACQRIYCLTEAWSVTYWG